MYKRLFRAEVKSTWASFVVKVTADCGSFLSAAQLFLCLFNAQIKGWLINFVIELQDTVIRALTMVKLQLIRGQVYANKRLSVWFMASQHLAAASLGQLAERLF